jgi:hypothetical protein
LLEEARDEVEMAMSKKMVSTGAEAVKWKQSAPFNELLGN